MATVTLADASAGLEPSVTKGVVRTLVENSPIAQVVPFKHITGQAHQYQQEATLPSVAGRHVNGSYTSSRGSHVAKMRALKIRGGAVEIDRFILKTQGPNLSEDEKKKQYRLFGTALSRDLDNVFFNGDDDSDPTSPRGLKQIVTDELASTQNMLMGAGGAALTLATFENAVDRTVGKNVHAFMNRFLWRKLSRLIDAATGAQQITVTKSKFNMPTYEYQGVQIHVMERTEDGSTVLGFNEDPGDGTFDTASIYIVSLDEEMGVHGIANGGMGVLPEMEDYGEIIPPNHLGFGEWYYNFENTHPRGITRVYGILEA